MERLVHLNAFTRPPEGFFSCNCQRAVLCLMLTLRVCTCCALTKGKGQNCSAVQPTSQSQEDGTFLIANDFFFLFLYR